MKGASSAIEVTLHVLDESVLRIECLESIRKPTVSRFLALASICSALMLMAAWE